MSEDKNKVPRILVGTPCYNGLLHQDYVRSIIEFNKLGWPMAYVHVGNESLITRARNTILSFYYSHRSNFDYLLFMDADIYLSVEDLVGMVEAKKDVIGCPVPMKGLSETGERIYNVGEIYERGNIAKAEHVGTAVFMLSTNVIEVLVAECIKENKMYTPSSLSRGLKQTDMQYDVFSVGVIENKYYSEDYYLCLRLRKLGFDINLLTSANVLHNGIVTF